jgi:putative transposase
MSQALSPSTGHPHGLARVCRVWDVARSTVYWQRHASSAPGARQGPIGPCADDELVDQIQRILAASPFPGEGYRAVNICRMCFRRS